MKYEWIINKNNVPEIGINIATVYKKNQYKVELYNVVYTIFSKEFIYNKNIHLSKKLIRYFESHICENILLNELKKFNIYDLNEVKELIEEYEKYKIKQEILKHKILTLKKPRNLNFKKN